MMLADEAPTAFAEALPLNDRECVVRLEGALDGDDHASASSRS